MLQCSIFGQTNNLRCQFIAECSLTYIVLIWQESYLGPLVLLLQKFLDYLAFQSFYNKHTWWSLFQKRVGLTNLDIYDNRFDSVNGA
jgi:hypothetical protein